MITYTGTFNLSLIIVECRKVAALHLNKNNVDESEVPFCNEGGEVRYMQFLNVLGSWVYVGVRS